MASSSEPHDLLVGLLLVQNSLDRRSESFFQPLGLTGAQFNILNLLGRHDGRLDQATLVDLLLVGKSSISIVLNRMVRDGLVKREEHASDRRQVVLALTAKGRALWRRVTPRYDARVAKAFGALPAVRRQRFMEDLKALYENLADGDKTETARWDDFWKNV